MENRKSRQWSGMMLVFMAFILMATISLSAPTFDRATRTLDWVIEKLKKNPTPRTPEEIRERWRLTRPGMLLSENFVLHCEAPGIRALSEKESGQPGSQPLLQARGSHTNP